MQARFIHNAKILLKRSRTRLVIPESIDQVQKLEQVMHDQLNIHNDQQDKSTMEEKVLKVHSIPEPSKEKLEMRMQDWYLDTAHNVPDNWEGFIPKWQRSLQKQPLQKSLEESPNLTLQAVISTIEKENGINTVAINMTQKCDYADALIITEGSNARHVIAIAEAVRLMAKSKIKTDSTLPRSIYESDNKCNDWIIVDMGKYILHVFTADSRKFYDLEGLWTLLIDPMKDSNLSNDLIAERVLRNFKSKMEQIDSEDKDMHERNRNES